MYKKGYTPVRYYSRRNSGNNHQNYHDQNNNKDIISITILIYPQDSTNKNLNFPKNLENDHEFRNSLTQCMAQNPLNYQMSTSNSSLNEAVKRQRQVTPLRKSVHLKASNPKKVSHVSVMIKF